MSGAVLESGGGVALSTASVYPDGCAAAFATARRLGYDGVEVMVWTDPVSQEPGALAALSELHGIPVLSVHAPTLLLTQRVWSTDPWTKVDNRSSWPGRWARRRGAPPARSGGRRSTPASSSTGSPCASTRPGIRLAVENMFPWRARNREYQAYLPGWDPVPLPYDNVTLDLSHTSTAGSDALQMATELRVATGARAPRGRHRLRQGRAPRPRSWNPAMCRVPRNPCGAGATQGPSWWRSAPASSLSSSARST